MLRAVLLSSFLCACAGNLQTLLYPNHDGADRILTLAPASLADARLQNHDIVLLVSGGPVEVQVASERMLQLTAQIMETQSIAFAKLNAGSDVAALTQEGLKPGGVYYIKGGVTIPYHGYRSHDVLISFIKKAAQGPLSVIDGKATKKAFDVMDGVRVVGYFTAGSQELVEFEKAAVQHISKVPFFVVTDPLVAPHLKMNTTGTVQIVQPFQKYGVALLQNPATVADITNALASQSKPVIRRITRENIHELEDLTESSNQIHVMAFMRKGSAHGYQMDKMLRKMAKYGTNTTSTSVITIDPDDFPALQTHWTSSLNVSLEEPLIGLVNLSDHKSRWFNISDMMGKINSTDETDILHSWLLEVENGTYTIDPPPVEELPTGGDGLCEAQAASCEGTASPAPAESSVPAEETGTPSGVDATESPEEGRQPPTEL